MVQSHTYLRVCPSIYKCIYSSSVKVNWIFAYLQAANEQAKEDWSQFYVRSSTSNIEIRGVALGHVHGIVMSSRVWICVQLHRGNGRHGAADEKMISLRG